MTRDEFIKLSEDTIKNGSEIEVVLTTLMLKALPLMDEMGKIFENLSNSGYNNSRIAELLLDTLTFIFTNVGKGLFNDVTDPELHEAIGKVFSLSCAELWKRKTCHY